MRLAVIGAGGHAKAAHLPALAELSAQRDVELVAVADPNIDSAHAAAAEYGFATSYDNIARLFQRERLDACVIVTPSSTIPDLLLHALRHDVACLVEKPFAGSVADADRLMQRLGAGSALAMVSANRRFDPALTAAISWLTATPTSWAATMARTARTEARFVYNTGVHLVDAAAFVNGPLALIAQHSSVGEPTGEVQALLRSESGSVGSITIAPRSGAQLEQLELHAPGRSAIVRFGSMSSSGWDGWASGALVAQGSTAELAEWQREGTLAETVAFLDAIELGRDSPVSLSGFLESMRIAHALDHPAGMGQVS
jgi:predicted dehydrogenase